MGIFREVDGRLAYKSRAGEIRLEFLCEQSLTSRDLAFEKREHKDLKSLCFIIAASKETYTYNRETVLRFAAAYGGGMRSEEPFVGKTTVTLDWYPDGLPFISI